MNFTEVTVTKIVQETSDSYSYIMEAPAELVWKAGQHALFKFRDYQVAEGDRDSRIFSIASAPEDGFLMFTTRIADPHTSFKEILLRQLKEGDVILMASPLGSFDLSPEDEKTLIIAGGIGITPIRSLLAHYMRENNSDHKITVFYSDDRGEFCYGDFWKEARAAMPNLDLHLISDRDEFTGKVSSYAKANQNASGYMIAGSPGMNKAFTATLTGLGVDGAKIHTDNFMGY